jgi:hypothetical protein
VNGSEQLRICPAILVISQSLKEGCQPPFDLGTIISARATGPQREVGTVSCLTILSLKSSSPVYTPCVTRKPPSTLSSRKLRARSRCFSASRSRFLCSRAARSASRSRSRPSRWLTPRPKRVCSRLCRDRDARFEYASPRCEGSPLERWRRESPGRCEAGGDGPLSLVEALPMPTVRRR